MSPVQLLLKPSTWVKFVDFFLLLWFFEVFATVSVQQYQLLIFFVFFVFLPLGFLRKNFTLTYIQWQSFHPSTFHIDFFIELLILATEPSEKIYRDHPPLQALHWIDVFLLCQGFGSSSLTV